MIDLVCLVADKNIEAAVQGVLRRPKALGIRAIQRETIVHPQRDPGCFYRAGALLRGYKALALHALVVLDWDWAGAPPGTGEDAEQRLEQSLRTEGFGDWARAIVIDPELEVWVFSDSPHVATALGWKEDTAAMRRELETRNLWPKDAGKPSAPKEAVEFLLRRARTPRSSSMFRNLSEKVSLERCEDRSFRHFRAILRGWFGDERR